MELQLAYKSDRFLGQGLLLKFGTKTTTMMNHPDIATTSAVVIAKTAAVTTDNSTMESTCEICGWMAAICSALAFGTFAVPIKSNVARSVNIDPLVFQSYKTIMCFTTAWLILLVPNHHTFVFTPWGIVSGLFWVPRYVNLFVSDWSATMHDYIHDYIFFMI